MSTTAIRFSDGVSVLVSTVLRTTTPTAIRHGQSGEQHGDFRSEQGWSARRRNGHLERQQGIEDAAAIIRVVIASRPVWVMRLAGLGGGCVVGKLLPCRSRVSDESAVQL